MAQRTWLITGVNSGFGCVMTEQLLARGDRVAGTIRKLDSMSDLKARYGARLWLAQLDVTDTAAIKRVVDQAFADLGAVVEPGGARTAFRSTAGAQLGAKLDAYESTPAGMVQRILQDTSRQPSGDPAKMVKLMIDSVDQSPAPKRLVLGSDAYVAIQKALTERLAAVEAQKELAASTDFSAAA